MGGANNIITKGDKIPWSGPICCLELELLTKVSHNLISVWLKYSILFKSLWSLKKKKKNIVLHST